jgi:hypothetical protein
MYQLKKQKKDDELNLIEWIKRHHRLHPRPSMILLFSFCL